MSLPIWWDEIRAFDDGTPMYYGLDGEPISLNDWASLFGDLERKVLARTTIGPREVITAWSGLDGNPMEEGPPLIFGSIIKHGPLGRGLAGGFSDEIETATKAEALAAHQMLVIKARRMSRRVRTTDA